MTGFVREIMHEIILQSTAYLSRYLPLKIYADQNLQQLNSVCKYHFNKTCGYDQLRQNNIRKLHKIMTAQQTITEKLAPITRTQQSGRVFQQIKIIMYAPSRSAATIALRMKRNYTAKKQSSTYGTVIYLFLYETGNSFRPHPHYYFSDPVFDHLTERFQVCSSRPPLQQ